MKAYQNESEQTSKEVDELRDLLLFILKDREPNATIRVVKK